MDFLNTAAMVCLLSCVLVGQIFDLSLHIIMAVKNLFDDTFSDNKKLYKFNNFNKVANFQPVKTL